MFYAGYIQKDIIFYTDHSEVRFFVGPYYDKMKNKIGVISGFIFGVIAVFLSTIGLISLSAEVLSPFLFPIAFFIRLFEINFTGMLVIASLLNAVLFSLIGYFIQDKFGKKNKKIALYVFLGVIILFFVLVFVEYLVKGLSP